jgi:hypothetical protein
MSYLHRETRHFARRCPPILGGVVANGNISASLHAVRDYPPIFVIVQPAFKVVIDALFNHVQRDNLGPDYVVGISWINVAKLIERVR